MNNQSVSQSVSQPIFASTKKTDAGGARRRSRRRSRTATWRARCRRSTTTAVWPYVQMTAWLYLQYLGPWSLALASGRLSLRRLPFGAYSPDPCLLSIMCHSCLHARCVCVLHARCVSLVYACFVFNIGQDPKRPQHR